MSIDRYKFPSAISLNVLEKNIMPTPQELKCRNRLDEYTPNLSLIKIGQKQIGIIINMLENINKEVNISITAFWRILV
jgi:hypothetical protein